MRIPLKFLNEAFTVVVLFLATAAFQPLVIDVSNQNTLTQGTAFQLVRLCIYILVALRALPRYRQISWFIRSNKLLIFLLALAVLSTLWSGDPGLTFRRSIALLATTLFGIDFALRYPIRDQLRMLCFVLGLTVLLSVIVQICWPGSMPVVDAANGGGWNGAFGHKNAFARIIVLTSVAFIVRSSSRKKLLKACLVIVCAIVLIVASQSRTAAVVSATLLLLLVIAHVLRSTRQPRIAFFTVLVVGLPVLYFASVNLDYLTGMLGRESRLTGRVDIWQLAFASFLKRPLLGYGYSAFWKISPDALRINGVLHWAVPNAHNGFIDLALELGLVGLCLYLTYYVVSVRRAVDYARSNSSVEGMWPFAYLAFTFLYNITESSPLPFDSIFWILYTSVTCSLAVAPACHSAEAEGGDAEIAEPQPNLQFISGHV
jgi:O-antigen ligase